MSNQASRRDRAVGRAQDFQRLGDQPLVAAGADADAADEQRDRPDPFVVVGLDPAAACAERPPADGR